MELEIETLKEQNYMLTEKLSQLINMTIGSFHIVDVSQLFSAREHIVYTGAREQTVFISDREHLSNDIQKLIGT